MSEKPGMWVAPKVSRFGTFTELTRQQLCSKVLGATDGFTYQGQGLQTLACTS
jgi:hypothetical protein